VAAVEKSIGAWRAAGFLAGDQGAALRSALRDSAEACDQARKALRDGEGSAYTLAMCASRLADMLVAVAPADSSDADEWGQILAVTSGDP
jgi:hypothetical protein